jgi:hypothetical protein
VVNILLVRSRQELTDEARAQIQAMFPDQELNFIGATANTSQELLDEVAAVSAEMVVLRDEPLPERVLKQTLVPVVPIRPGQPLARIKAVNVELEVLNVVS